MRSSRPRSPCSKGLPSWPRRRLYPVNRRLCAAAAGGSVAGGRFTAAGHSTAGGGSVSVGRSAAAAVRLRPFRGCRGSVAGGRFTAAGHSTAGGCSISVGCSAAAAVRLRPFRGCRGSVAAGGSISVGYSVRTADGRRFGICGNGSNITAMPLQNTGFS